jgi:hypothetical protein
VLVGFLLFSVLRGVPPLAASLAAHAAPTHTAHILGVSSARQQDQGQDCCEDSHFGPFLPSVPVSKVVATDSKAISANIYEQVDGPLKKNYQHFMWN